MSSELVDLRKKFESIIQQKKEEIGQKKKEVAELEKVFYNELLSFEQSIRATTPTMKESIDMNTVNNLKGKE